MNEPLWNLHDFEPDLADQEIHVWRSWLNCSDSDLTQIKSRLSDEELEVASNFHFEHDRARYLISHGILRQILSYYLSIPPEEIQFGRNKFGKPLLETGEIKFNISHSENMALFAFTMRSSIGVDIEYIYPIKDFHLIAKSFLSSEELKAFRNLPTELQQDSFFRTWTRKEALSKAIGAGITLPLKQLEVGVNPKESPILMISDIRNLEPSNWKVVDLILEQNYVGAVAFEGSRVSPTLYTYPLK